MTSDRRFSLVALEATAATGAIATVVVPTRVRFGSFSFTCGNVLRRPRPDVVATAICDIAGAYWLRATVAIAALLAVLCVVPVVLAPRQPLARLAWATTIVVVAVVSFTLLAAVGARFDQVFIDL